MELEVESLTGAPHGTCTPDRLTHSRFRHLDGTRAALSSATGTASLRWFHSRIANGLIEGIKSLVQGRGRRGRERAAKAKARGYRSVRNLKAMVYLLAAKLNLMLPN